MPKQKILECAFELFSKGHYNSVTLAEIAEKAGIKKPSIYSHFASKEALFLEVLDGEVERVYIYLNKIIEETRELKLEIILKQLLLESITYVRENAPVGGFWAYLLFVTSHDLPEQVVLRIEDLKSYMEELFFQLFKRGIDQGEIIKRDADSLVYSFICLLQGNLLMELNSKKFHVSKVNNSWDYFWEGVRNKN